MEFKQWLNESNINFLFMSNGEVVANIDGIKYKYITDTAFHKRWRELSKYKPWTVLNDIKKHIELGNAQQILPKPIAQKTGTPKNLNNNPKTQKFLF